LEFVPRDFPSFMFGLTNGATTMSLSQDFHFGFLNRVQYITTPES
jgi:hypothetical protein